MSDAALPEAARTRLASSSFGSALSSADLSATLAAGLEPLGLVQGTCVLQWGWYGYRSPYGGASPIGSGTRRLKHRYFEPRGADGEMSTGRTGFLAGRRVRSIVYQSPKWSTWACQHAPTTRPNAKHEPGVNFEQSWVEELWSEGFNTARERLVAEAIALGAHGIVGVFDEIATPTRGVREFLLRGTAVRVIDAPAPRQVWSTFLAGERLIKLVEAGWAPVSVLGAHASIRVWPACSTESQLTGTWSQVSRIRQIENAHDVVRATARDRVHGEAGSDDVHGVRYEVAEHRIARGDDEISCTVWGSRIRRFAPPERFPAPTPTVTLR